MQLLKVAATTVCLSLASFSGISCHGQDLATHGTSKPEAKPVVTADSVELINAEKISVDRECLAREIDHLRKMIISGGLDPIRAEVFDKHPLVTAVVDAPHIKLTFQGREYLVPLEAEYPNIIAIVPVNGGESYAAYAPIRSEKFSLRSCHAK